MVFKRTKYKMSRFSCVLLTLQLQKLLLWKLAAALRHSRSLKLRRLFSFFATQKRKADNFQKPSYLRGCKLSPSICS